MKRACLTRYFGYDDLVNANLILVAYNMLPLQSLDGGRVYAELLKSSPNKLGTFMFLLASMLFTGILCTPPGTSMKIIFGPLSVVFMLVSMDPYRKGRIIDTSQKMGEFDRTWYTLLSIFIAQGSVIWLTILDGWY